MAAAAVTKVGLAVVVLLPNGLPVVAGLVPVGRLVERMVFVMGKIGGGLGLQPPGISSSTAVKFAQVIRVTLLK